ncbi:MAG: PGPGW domain-containing protein [Acidimicrobiia bacterium]
MPGQHDPSVPNGPIDLNHDGRLSDVEIAAIVAPERWRRFGLRGPAIIVRFIGRNARRTAVAVLGVAVMAAGAAMLVLPGPGVVVVIVGLAVLATEFVWAERALDRAKGVAGKATSTLNSSRTGRGVLIGSGVSMMAGGVVCAIAVEALLAAGIGVAVAGAIALATLLPAVQRWLDGQTA